VLRERHPQAVSKSFSGMRSVLIKTFDESTRKNAPVVDLSFHLQSPANSLRRALSNQISGGTQIAEEFIMTQITPNLQKGMPINFNNLIVGRHESKVLFMWNPPKGVAMLGAFVGIKIGIEAILARDEITPAQRVILEEFRAIAGKNNWDFVTLRDSLS
jgi:hypothetical protein